MIIIKYLSKCFEICCFLLLFLLPSWQLYSLSSSTKLSYNSALNRAKDYFKNQTNIDDIGSLFLKQRFSPEFVLAEDIPAFDAFGRLFSERHGIKDLKIERKVRSISEAMMALKRNNNKFHNYFYDFPEKVKNTLVHSYDDVLIKALYCDKSGFDQLDLAILLSMRDHQGGYADTHGLLGLLFLEGNQCLDGGSLNKAKNTIVKTLVEALEKDTVFSDLYAERVACLFWAGAGALVKPEWIQKIKESQRHDGGWANVAREDSSPHTTGLAALVIRYLLTGEKPYFYQK